MNKRTALSLAFVVSFYYGQMAGADSTLEYLVHESGADAGKTQPVLVKNGKIMVKAAGGDANLDVLYVRDQAKLVIIDHHKRTFTPIDEQQVNRISQQTEEIQPLLQGLGEQLAKVNPKQRAKWEQMLGGNISLDKIAEAAKPAQAVNVVKAGTGKNVAGIACEQMNVIEGKSAMAEFCIADPDKLNLSSDDYATIRSLLTLAEKLAGKTQGLARQFGISIPNIALRDVAGVPIEMRDLSGNNQGSLTLNRIVTSALSDDLLQIPNGYRAEQFQLWK